MNSRSRWLTDLLDEKFGVDNRVYRLPVIPILTKSPEGGESMDKKRNDTARRSGLQTGVRTLLFDNPDREWHLKEVMDAIGHQNLGSVSSCLNNQHRDPKVAIDRVGPNTYRVNLRPTTNPDWVAATARLVPTEAAEVTTGDLLEIIGCYNGESIAVDLRGNLLALGTMRVIGRV
jgi:hypothetical protein